MAADRNKEKFLNDLREYLGVLEEQEQEDILAEYAQHIDMKMQKGLSEEEAIRDFGPVEELAAEILAAYHVDSRHAMSIGKRGIRTPAPGRLAGAAGQLRLRRRPDGTGAEQHGQVSLSGSVDGLAEADAGQKDEKVYESAFRRAGRWIRKVYSGTIRSVRNGFCRIGKACRHFMEWCRKPFHRKGERDGTTATETKEKRKGIMGELFRAMGRNTVKLWKWFLDCCIFWMRMFWNIAWLLFSMICAGMAMLVLMGIGATVVFLYGGYPFWGILVLGLGGMLCFGALSAGAFGMMIRKKEKKGDGREDRIDREVHYEQTA